MPAKSKAQQKAAAIALLAKNNKIPKNKLYGPSKNMLKMKTKDLEKLANTDIKNLPYKVNEIEDVDNKFKKLKSYILKKILNLNVLLNTIYYELKAKKLSVEYKSKILNKNKLVALYFCFKIFNNIKNSKKLYLLLKPIFENKKIYILFNEPDFSKIIFNGIKENSKQIIKPKNLNEAEYFIEKFYIEQELYLKSILKKLSNINIIIKI